MTPAEADAYSQSSAAYVHVPFCSSVCPYCDFAVVAGRDDLVDRYIDAVCTEITSSEPWRPLEAIYFGGGTPSHVDPSLLGGVLDTLSLKHGISDEAEVSLEANPEDFDVARATVLRSLGFNRVSFGAQSFDAGVLVALGRRHQAGQIESSLRAAREAGFENVSLDLIYGTPGETTSSWRDTLSRAIDLDPDHISCYALTVESGTPLGRAVRDGAEAPDPDTQADRYESADMVLGAAGHTRYEVSNWSHPGHECRYNLTVWAQGQYEAYGNGSHGYRDGVRFRNIRRIDAYVSAVESDETPRSGNDVVAGWDAEIDRLFVGLRRVVGVAPGPGGTAFLQSESGRRLVDAGVVSLVGGRLTVDRPLLTDEVYRCVLDLEAPHGAPKESTKTAGADIVSMSSDA
ncbi:MAG: radical SAM family heme chaperone HemW [Actinobacteria bacterium]|nr:radical SAM family heme chaperone HemW [Actinomycetota bacterium]